MVKIYSSARSVVVWLGDCHLVQAKETFEFVKLIANQLSRVKEETGSKDIRWEDYHVLRIPSEYTCASTRDLLKLLYARSWFSRIWCVQKIILAKDAVMLWGELELPWTHVSEIATWLTKIQPVRALDYTYDAIYADIK
jgi:hypothetical protein